MDAGNELGIKMERLTLANQALNAAISWANRAEEAASADHTTPPDERPSLIEVAFCSVICWLFMMAMVYWCRPPNSQPERGACGDDRCRLCWSTTRAWWWRCRRRRA